MWVPTEQIDPVLLHAPTRKNMGVFGAVCAKEGILVTGQAPRFNAETFQSFLGKLLCYRRHGREMVLVLDNCRWHHAKALTPWLASKQGQIRLEFLPPYSPELNPIERVWKLTRRLCTHNRYFESLEELIETVEKQFNQWLQPNDQLRRLCAIT